MTSRDADLPPRVAPTTIVELAEIIAEFAASGQRLEIRGNGSKAAVGCGAREATILDMRGFTGIVDYDPAELVLTVRAGTPLADVQALLARERQMLAFEPLEWPVGSPPARPTDGPAVRSPGCDAPAGATLGGVVAAGSSGPRRLSRGAARDHVLGFTAVSGRGEAFVAGGKVVKNVTGYDLPKLLAGSWGRLAALVEITLKVLPRPAEARTLVAARLDAARAWSVMARALGSQAEVAAAAHLPGGIDGHSEALTLLRLEGWGPSIAARAAMFDRLFAGEVTLQPADAHANSPAEAAAPAEAGAAAGEVLWRAVTTLAPLAAQRGSLWRLSLPARAMPGVIERLGAGPEAWLADWAGGLVWLRSGTAAAEIRTIVAATGGHAMLASDPDGHHAGVPTFQPQPAALAALEARVRRGFDPAGVFATGRFGDDAY